jgi:endoglucanase
VPNNLSAPDLAQARQALITAADALLARAATDAYGSPLGTYGWGSNGDMLNAGMLLALAHDISGDARYRTGALATLDYVLGRNPLDRSYVTGYGARPFMNAHHRFWAHAFDPSYPTPPPGVMAGGANARLEGLSTSDPLVGCAPMKCWRDDAQAYSLAEVTVNWNAPLAWMAAWVSELGTNPASTHPGVTGMGAGGAGGGDAAASGGGGTNGGGGRPGDGSGGQGAADAGATGGTISSGDGGGDTAAQSGGGCGCSLAPADTGGVALPLLVVGTLLSFGAARRRRLGRTR